ncbi:Uncharacterised protein [Streptococcus suis]|uniref:Uncharacterized protein n=1 Tax=Streptococcus suis TaxID=1307 RepID=A0A0Z8M8H2_STRSU|nr:hypothetical protein [Streptococcus suis]MDW8705799.1 hypothetical protein [Streptococcus suis]NQG28614.1 hypothetical protein [Streptococcus suis]NQH17349.1 hypothetical protein [Streptococcus suis]NQH35027.1 hypothetical protein [Streptococcus suis]NQJ19351.1 hypothetical protein [Streptococcus suis]
MKNKKFYAVLIPIVLWIVFKICANLSDENINDYFNILAVSNPGLIIAFAIFTNREQNKEK